MGRDRRAGRGRTALASVRPLLRRVVDITTINIMSKRSGRRPVSVPLSLRFPPELRSRVKKYAASHGLEEATAIRALCTERLRELELTDDLALAERWQRARATESWDQLERGELKLASAAEVRRILVEARDVKR